MSSTTPTNKVALPIKEKKQKSALKISNTVKTEDSKFQKGKFLGEGGYGICYEYRKIHTKDTYCLKAISKKKVCGKSLDYLTNEISVQSSLKHEGIVELYKSFQDKKYHYLLMEIMKGGDLKDLLNRRTVLSEPEAKYYLFKILMALQHLHQKGYMHRDLKLANILLTKDCVPKIGDFGLATKAPIGSSLRTSFCGTLAYIAPEVVLKRGYDSKADLWSIGVIAYQLLFGKYPFDITDPKQIDLLHAKIVCVDFKIPEDSPVSEAGKDFVRFIFHNSPLIRPTIEQLLQHEWLKPESIPKSLPSSALISDPEIKIDASSQDHEMRSKQFRANNGNLKREIVTSSSNGLTLFQLDARKIIEKSVETLIGCLRKMIANPGAVPADTKPALREKPSQYIVKLNRSAVSTPFQMLDGAEGAHLNKGVIVMQNVNKNIYNSYEKLESYENQYACSLHTKSSLEALNPEFSENFEKAMQLLKLKGNICSPTFVQKKRGRMDDLKEVIFPISINFEKKYVIIVFSNGTVQVVFLQCGSVVIYEPSLNRITFFYLGKETVFNFDMFLYSALSSLTGPYWEFFSERVDLSKIDPSKLEPTRYAFPAKIKDPLIHYFNCFLRALNLYCKDNRIQV